MDDRTDEWVEVQWGPEKFAPIAYHTLDLGPFTCRTKVRKGETTEAAVLRAWEALDRQARVLYNRQKTAFLERCSEVATEARNAAKKNRTV